MCYQYSLLGRGLLFLFLNHDFLGTDIFPFMFSVFARSHKDRLISMLTVYFRKHYILSFTFRSPLPPGLILVYGVR